MTTVTAKEARVNFSDLLNRVAYQDEKYVVTRNSKPVAAVIPVAYLKVLENALEQIELQQDVAEARAALEEYERTGESVTIEELERELGMDPQ